MERKATKTTQTTRTVVTVAATRFGHDPFPVIAGPAAVESERQINVVAQRVVEAGGSVLRGGAFKRESSPYSFRGLGASAVKMLVDAGQRVGLPTATQVIEAGDVGPVAEKVDLLEVNAGSMQDFELLRAIGRSSKPVLLRRGPSATIDEWLWAAEYLLAEGNRQVVLVERGIRTFGSISHDTLDIASVPAVQELSHLPVVIDPSYASGGHTRITPLALAAQGVGADGLIIQVHPDPDRALTSGTIQLDPVSFGELMTTLGIIRMRDHIDLIDREVVRLLSRRQELALDIGRVKAVSGQAIQNPERERELLEVIRTEGETRGMDPDHLEQIFQLVLTESRRLQQQLRNQPTADQPTKSGS